MVLDTGSTLLEWLHQSHVQHPSGVASLGYYLFVNEGSFLRIFNIDEADQVQDYRIFGVDNPIDGGGGLAVARLRNGGHLLITANPGNVDNRPRLRQFDLLLGSDLLAVTDDHQIPIGASMDLDSNVRFSENLSVIPECETGDIYVVHTTGNGYGDADDWAYGADEGYWILSRLIWRDFGNPDMDGQPGLEHIDSYIVPQSLADCHLRSAATTWVNPGHEILFACHEYIRRRESNAEDADVFRFQIRLPN